ncbi:MAG: L-2-hydroxyglutarate oxidase [Bacteroidales bacterium]|nr:L-2-hydroxyglutarate oxidase [Bacteroidales bacterium]
MQTSDFLIVGGGIIGLSIARELKKKYPDCSITIIEKESGVAMHSSGRNSGVLHAGFYYTADSLKAKFCRDGCKALNEYCKENNLRINECKKVVVAKNETELVSLFELEKRGKKNKVNISIIDEKQLNEIEPNAKTHQYALFSPTTGTVDPVEVNEAIKTELKNKGVIIKFNEAYKKRIDGNKIITQNNNKYEAGKIINTAGLYADKIARQFGFSDRYTIIPFKGIYLKYTNTDKPVKTNIYPVPNLKNPFLGVHFTVMVDGIIKIGPTSIPAFWRENYKNCSNFRGKELFNILGWESKLFFTNAFGFRSLAFDEIKKYNKSYFIKQATSLVKSINKKGFTEWTKPGIRAQLLNKKTYELVQDFVVEGDKKSVHILNAVSPAFTCSFPFAEYLADKYIISNKTI